MADEKEKVEKKKAPSILDTSLIEVLEYIALQASVSMPTLKLAIEEQSFEKNLSRRRIKKTIDEHGYDARDLRKRIIAHNKKYGRPTSST